MTEVDSHRTVTRRRAPVNGSLRALAALFVLVSSLKSVHPSVPALANGGPREGFRLKPHVNAGGMEWHAYSLHLRGGEGEGAVLPSSGESEGNSVVTAFEVKGVVDYDKLIDRFGSEVRKLFSGSNLMCNIYVRGEITGLMGIV